MRRAPSGVQNGFFISSFEFYEVQRSLLEGTRLAILVAIGGCLTVLFITTGNVVVSLLAVLSVTGVIVATLGGLVLLGWKLNILESIVVTAAIGLAVDLTLHYAVAYTKAPVKKRQPAVVWAIKRLGSPVAMTTLTTLTAAFAMVPANVLAYVHISTFLILISLSSFIYATFFFMPAMSLFGPEESCGQITTQGDCSQFCSCREDENLDKSVYQQACVSESTLSTSSVCPSAPYSSAQTTYEYDHISSVQGNYPHEMEPLTSPNLGANSAAGFNVPGTSKLRDNKNFSKLRDNKTVTSTGQPGSLGLIVSIQQCRQSRSHPQNGSCAQLVLRKESTESAEISSVSRSASVGSSHGPAIYEGIV